ncbi:RING finger domain protein [Paecilomyces variotii No. 5]|uniref:RING finger domain protein n=1 Tax=Byssochlamys spectabilis (strain No. 5 / NBRC 109023) TaxID=1356009 RepID=V5FXP0_BYSSN|nr:RING finger domain protein [Paecilomyces variotii No. 5]
MDSSAQKQGPQWEWPEDVPPASQHEHPKGGSEAADIVDESSDRSQPESERHYPPRTCRICLDSVPPTLQPPSENLPGFLQSKPRVVYVSPDPEFGRLLRPCRCKGSSRYVHEGCLRSWRHADPAYGKRNYWQCPTCGFQYKLERVTWARWISSNATQISLTLAILLFTVFLLGFIADPIINLYIEPLERIYPADMWEADLLEELQTEGTSSWFQHFAKGLASLGFLSFVKVFFAMSPWHWGGLRSFGFISSGGRSTGRNRIASISWAVILIGVCSFLWAVFKGVRAWCRRALEKAGERVMDVPLPDDEDEYEIASSTSNDSSKKDQ